jgi:hypothetical protein
VVPVRKLNYTKIRKTIKYELLSVSVQFEEHQNTSVLFLNGSCTLAPLGEEPVKLLRQTRVEQYSNMAWLRTCSS